MNQLKSAVTGHENKIKTLTERISELQKENALIKNEMKQEKLKMDANITKLKQELENTLDQYRSLLSQNRSEQKMNRHIEIFNNSEGMRNAQGVAVGGQYLKTKESQGRQSDHY